LAADRQWNSGACLEFAEFGISEMLIQLIKSHSADMESKLGRCKGRPPAPDREVVELFVARLRRQTAAETAEAAADDASEEPG
jgi:hypothetical protein